jgi:hypothetical protein
VAGLIRDRRFLLADTGPFCRFAEASSDQLSAMVDYLGDRVWIAQDVALELHRRAQTEQHRRLASLTWEPRFPRGEPLTITDAKLLQQIEDIAAGRLKKRPGHFLKDRGEIATVLLAKERGWPVLLDDTWGQKFAAKKGVEIITTEDLCVEMVVAGKLTEDHAFEVFKRVRWSPRGDFDGRVAAALS